MDYSDEYLRRARDLYACILASVMDRTMEGNEADTQVLQEEMQRIADQMKANYDVKI